MGNILGAVKYLLSVIIYYFVNCFSKTRNIFLKDSSVLLKKQHSDLCV